MASGNWTQYYNERVSPNIGILSVEEQEILRKSRVAIAGCGAVGGEVAEKLAYFGIGKINISDPDTVQLSNGNRQLCAAFSTVGRKKVDITEERLKDICPDIEINSFSDGVNSANVKSFLDGVDIVVDGIDYYELYSEIVLHRAAREKQLFVLTACCVGFGANMFVFNPDGMTLEQYIGLPLDADDSQIRKFEIPVDKFCPTIPPYIDRKMLDKIANKEIQIPTLVCGQAFGAGMLSTEVILFLLNRNREMVCVPQCFQFDFLERTFSTK